MKKYRGVFPALYACYDPAGHIDPRGVRYWTNLLCGKGVGGIYVNGLQGECGALNTAEKMTVMENVMAEADGRVRVLCNVSCVSPQETGTLCRHAAACGVDSIVVFALDPKVSLEKLLEEADRLVALSGECDLILGPAALPDGTKALEQALAGAKEARVRGLLLAEADLERLELLQEALGENVSLICAEASMPFSSITMFECAV